MDIIFARHGNIIYGALLALAFLRQKQYLGINNETLLIAGGLVFLFGIPHGAADTLIFRTIGGHRGFIGWALFGFVYILMAAAIYSLWLWSPPFFLGYLLLISVIHFGEDLHEIPHRWIKLSYGLAIVFSPALIWQSEVSALYGFIVESQAAILFAKLSNIISWISLANLALVSFAYRGSISAGNYFYLIWPITTLVILEPLLGFSLYFGLWHSRLHLNRLIIMKILDRKPISMLLLAVPLVVTIAGAFYLFIRLGGITDLSFSRIIFIGLGSLTFPHLFMVHALNGLGYRRG